MFHMKQLDSKTFKILENYAKILFKWNEKINLTSYEKKTLFNEAFFDCVVLAELLNQLKINQFVDLGSGNGIPGLIVKIINNRFDATLIDGSQKKIAFLEYLSRILDINVSIYQARLPDKRLNLVTNCVISKASMQECRLLKVAKTILAIGGWLIYFAGEVELIEDDKLELKGVLQYKRPDNSTSRIIVRKRIC